MWQKIIFVGAGGALGAMMRFVISDLGKKLFPAFTLPVGTLLVNVIGCLLIGFLGGLAETRNIFSEEIRAFLIVGILGGLTTFSALGFESFMMMRDGELLRSFANVGIQLMFGLFAVWVGFWISTNVMHKIV
jgi:CrcB protein